ncbi:MAG: S41 family peptidase [Rhodospirillales bacterium]|nr:MAG: S41 family peptidase [Rhodospirillales bacterium]
MKINWLRYVFSIVFLITLSACALAPAPGPEARAAADQLAADIDRKQRQHVGTANRAQPDVKLFARVFERVKAEYVRPVDEDMLIAAASHALADATPPNDLISDDWYVEQAINGMLASLDPYSTYLPRDEYEAMQDSMRGEFGGLGIQITLPDQGDGVLIIMPLAGTPAAAAGLMANDRITHVDGDSLDGYNLGQVVRRLRGPVGSRVVLTIRRGTEKIFDVEMARAVIHLDVVKWRLEGDFGYLNVAGFSEDTSDQIEEAIGKIRSHLGGRLAGLVIDLRDNPGGLLVESVAASDAFIESGDIVVTKGRHRTQRYRATGGDIVAGLPIAVLINRNSASAAEIFAAAMKDHNRALLIGTRSFGKGTVQTVMPMGRGTALKLTTAAYYSPSGKSVDGGIVPDIMVEDDRETDVDEGLQRAIAELNRLAAL